MNKKRLIAVFITTAMMLSLYMTVGMPVYAAETVIDDGFEVNYDGWVTEAPLAVLTAIEQGGHNSSRGMKLSNRLDKSDSVRSQKGLYLDGGNEYNYSVWVYHEAANAQAFTMTLNWNYDISEPFTTDTIVKKAVLCNRWTRLSGKFAAPDGAVNLMVDIASDSTDDFWFDDFKVTQTKPVYANVDAAEDSVKDGLKDRYANYFRVGNILHGGNNGTVNNNTIKAMFLKEYNSITPENELKPDAVLNQTGSTDANINVSLKSGAAAIINFATENNIPLRGHVLLWHAQIPNWFFTSDLKNPPSSGTVNWATQAQMDSRVESYISKLFAIYENQYKTAYIYSYDVVNEAMSETGGSRTPGFDKLGAQTGGGGDSPWVQIYGANNWKWVENAFTLARTYAPEDCKLFYNDYNEWASAKKTGIINNILVPLRNKGVLDGMGMQGHITANTIESSWDGKNAFNKAMDDYAALGIEVQITELDINRNGLNTSVIAHTEEQQTQRFKEVFEHAVELNKGNKGKVTLICIWGPHDGVSWRASGKPTMFDSATQAKPAFAAVQGVVPESEWGDGDNPSFDPGHITTPIEPDENGYYFRSTFENDDDGWSARGCTVARTTAQAYAGTNSMSATGRTDSWNGVVKDLNSAFVPGNSYSFSGMVKHTAGDITEDFYLTMQYNIPGDPETKYARIAAVAASPGKWAQLANTSFTIPNGASNISVYVESPNPISFFVDEMIGAVDGTVVTYTDLDKPDETSSPPATTTTPVTTSIPTGTTSPTTTASAQTTSPSDCGDCGECDVCPVVIGHIISNYKQISLADAMDVLMYLAKIDSSRIIQGGQGSRPWKAACISSIKATEPAIGDALQILMYLAGMPNEISLHEPDDE